MVKEIREWLEEEGGDYAAGLALYEAHGSSSVVLSALRYGETVFTRQKLRAELSKLVHIVATAAPRIAETPALVPVGPAAEHPERRTWYATRAYAHAQLELVGTDAERQELATIILATSEKITASYRAVEAPADEVPSPDLAALTDEGEIRRLLANLRPQRTKLKKNPDRAADLAQVVAQITVLETKLKNRDGEEPQLHPRN